jgi:hypothetical protein
MVCYHARYIPFSIIANVPGHFCRNMRAHVYAEERFLCLCCAGSNVSLTLYFLRFALGINTALCLFWLGGTIIPFMISPPTTFSWSYFKAYKPLDLLQGYGLHNTFLFYGKQSAIWAHHLLSCCLSARTVFSINWL